jgi:hypothetical protein
MSDATKGALNPYLTFWFQPRATISALSSQSKFHWSPWIISALLGASGLVNSIAPLIADHMESSRLLFVILFGSFLGLAHLFLLSLLLKFVHTVILSGKLFTIKSGTKFPSIDGRALRLAVGWSLLPSALLCVISTLIFFFKLSQAADTAPMIFIEGGIPYAEIWAPLVLIWSLGLIVVASSEVLKVSLWKAVLGLVLALVFLSIPIWKQT